VCARKCIELDNRLIDELVEECKEKRKRVAAEETLYEFIREFPNTAIDRKIIYKLISAIPVKNIVKRS